MGEHVGGVARRDSHVDDLGHHERHEELQECLEHLEQRRQNALDVVALEVAPQPEHPTSEKKPNHSILARAGARVLLAALRPGARQGAPAPGAIRCLGRPRSPPRTGPLCHFRVVSNIFDAKAPASSKVLLTTRSLTSGRSYRSPDTSVLLVAYKTCCSQPRKEVGFERVGRREGGRRAKPGNRRALSRPTCPEPVPGSAPTRAVARERGLPGPCRPCRRATRRRAPCSG